MSTYLGYCFGGHLGGRAYVLRILQSAFQAVLSFAELVPSWLLVNCDVEHTGAKWQGSQLKRYSASDFPTNSQAVSHLKPTTRRTDDRDTAPGPAPNSLDVSAPLSCLARPQG